MKPIPLRLGLDTLTDEALLAEVERRGLLDHAFDVAAYARREPGGWAVRVERRGREAVEYPPDILSMAAARFLTTLEDHARSST